MAIDHSWARALRSKEGQRARQERLKKYKPDFGYMRTQGVKGDTLKSRITLAKCWERK